MKQLRIRITVLVFTLSLVAALLAPDHTLPVSADGPQKMPHIMHTTDWYKQQRANQPFGPTDNLTYHGGPVLQTVKVYTIFWSPIGTTHPIPTDYQALVNRYFADIGGSSFYNINTQYYQTPPLVTMRNNSTLGGTWLDTANAYPHAGTVGDPLTNADIQAEVQRAITANSWPNGGLTNQYFVYTAQGIESCAGSECTPGISGINGYCAYHSQFNVFLTPYIYANMPYGETWTTSSTSCRDFSTSPNGNLAADAEISTSSHEHFEAATDPELNAWYDTNLQGEIGDKCAYKYLKIAGDGSNITLNHHPYIVQSEWSNAAFNGVAFSGCTLQYGMAAILGANFGAAMAQIPMFAAKASVIQIRSSAAFLPFVTR